MNFTSILVLLVVWIVVVRFLRYRRRDYIQSLDLHKDYEKIYKFAVYHEFPMLNVKALEFALFKTYGIPSISKLLAQTGEFSKRCPKRYDDTDLLLREIGENGIFGDRGELAVRRLNFLHGRYSIKNDDYLYTLSLFILEPITWINRFEWRQLTKKEEEAMFLMYVTIGQRMGIQNIPGSLPEFREWVEKYEKMHMVPAESNHEIAEATVKLFLSPVPTFLHGFARKCIYALCEDRLREAILYPKQPLLLEQLLFAILTARGLFVRYLMPPRPDFMIARRTNPDKNPLVEKSCPMYNPYEAVYKDGYMTDELGPAKKGLLGEVGKVNNIVM